MNEKRRKAIAKIAEDVRDLIGRLETIRDEEQEYLDNMPDSLQSGAKGDAASTTIENVESAIGDLENAESTLQE